LGSRGSSGRHDELSGFVGEVRAEVTHRDVTIEVGGCRLRFRSVNDDVDFKLRFPLTNFVTAAAEQPDCEVWCRVGEVDQLDAPVVHREEGPTWEIRRAVDGRDEVTYFTPAGSVLVPRIAIRFNGDLSRVDLQYRPSVPGDRVVIIDFPIDEYMLCRILSRRRALVLHACAVEIDGRALVFTGHSGAGKSTIAEIAESAGGRVMSDDRTILAVDEGGEVRAYGTPWHGSFRRGQPTSAPVAGIFLLMQAGDNRVVPLAPVPAFGELFTRTIQPTVLDAEVDMVIRSAEHIVARVPVGVLRFLPNRGSFEAAMRAVTP